MIKTVNLTTAVTAVEVSGKTNVTVKNIGNNTAYVSVSPDVSAGGDDCLSVAAGEIVTLEGVATLKKVNDQYGIHGTVYAFSSSATTIELITTNSVNFKSAAVDFSEDISAISSLIPAAASPDNQLADKAYVSAAASGSPYTYMTQAEYESLTEYEPDRMYWVTYPLSKCHLVWCNGECVDGIGAENLAGYQLAYSNSSYKSYAKCNYKYLAIAYNPISAISQNTYSNLIKMDIAKGVTSIGQYAFYGCSGLTNVSIPDGVTSIGQYAFYKCQALTDISIPDGVTSIGAGAFYKCQALTDISIPAGVTEIKGDTFVSCGALTFVSIPSTITTIAVQAIGVSSAAFSQCTQSDLTIMISKPQDSISGSPWGAENATIVWTG